MTNESPKPVSPKPVSPEQQRLETEVEKRRRRRIASRKSSWTVMRGFGAFGMVGWSIAGPTVVGAAIGWWLDRHVEHRISFTLTGMTIGLVTGCWVAWYWIRQEGILQQWGADGSDETPDEPAARPLNQKGESND